MTFSEGISYFIEIFIERYGGVDDLRENVQHFLDQRSLAVILYGEMDGVRKEGGF